MRIGAIDPGTLRAGHSVIDLDRIGGGIRVLEIGTWALRGANRMERLGNLADEAGAFVERYALRVLVIEGAWVGEFASAALALGEARGVVIGVAHRADVTIVEYQPKEIKKAIAGKGNASKALVAQALASRFGLAQQLVGGPEYDATDALALAVTHAPAVRRPRFV